MKSKFVKKSESGIAMLEAAGAMIFLCILLMGIFGLVEYMRLSRTLVYILDKNVYETALKPYVIASEFNGQGPNVTLNELKLKEYIETATENMAAELEPYLRRVTAVNDPKFAVDIAFTELNVNTDSGTIIGLNADAEYYAYSDNDPAMQASLNSYLNLNQKFSSYAQLVSENSAYYAAPQANHVLGQTLNRYLPSNVLIAARVGISLEDTFLGNMLEVAGQEPFISDIKIITLRGEVSDEA